MLFKQLYKPMKQTNKIKANKKYHTFYRAKIILGFS